MEKQSINHPIYIYRLFRWIACQRHSEEGASYWWAGQPLTSFILLRVVLGAFWKQTQGRPARAEEPTGYQPNPSPKPQTRSRSSTEPKRIHSFSQESLLARAPRHAKHAARLLAQFNGAGVPETVCSSINISSTLLRKKTQRKNKAFYHKRARKQILGEKSKQTLRQRRLKHEIKTNYRTISPA